jgi:hypothetical protein
MAKKKVFWNFHSSILSSNEPWCDKQLKRRGFGFPFQVGR